MGLFSVAVIGALHLAACGSDSGAPAMPTGTGGASGSSGAGGGSGGDSNPSTGGASQGACNAPAPKVIAKAGYGAEHLVVSGSDLYLIDTSKTFVTSIRHLKDDGTGDSTVYTAPDISSKVTDLVVDKATIYFVEYNPAGGFAVLYQIPTSGGSKTKISKGDGYGSGSADLGGAANGSVFVSVPNSTGQQLRRVSAQDGTETVIAEHSGLVFTSIQIYGSDIWFAANQGLDGFFKVPLTATTSSAMQVGPDACVYEGSVTSAGVYCSGGTQLQKMPLTGGSFTNIWALPDGPVDASRPDGNFIYLAPSSATTDSGALRKYPIMGGNPTDLSCNRTGMSVPVFNDRAIFWLEADSTDVMTTNVYSVAK